MFRRKSKELKFIIDTVEGRVTTEKFYEELKRNEKLLTFLISDKKRTNSNKRYNYPGKIYLNSSIKNIFDRYDILSTLSSHLCNKKIKFNYDNIDFKNVSMYFNIQPSWLSIRDEDFFNDLFSKAPNNLNNNEKNKWCRKEILKLYKYDTRPPKWLQEPEWPLDRNGNPMIFKKQETDQNDPTKELYCFYDKDNNEKIIEQFD